MGTKHDLRTHQSHNGVVRIYGETLDEESFPITAEEGADLAKEFGAVAYAECSALSGEGVVDVFNVATLVSHLCFSFSSLVSKRYDY